MLLIVQQRAIRFPGSSSIRLVDCVKSLVAFNANRCWSSNLIFQETIRAFAPFDSQY